MATKTDAKKAEKETNGKKDEKEQKPHKPHTEEFVKLLTEFADGAAPAAVRRLFTRMLHLTGPATPTITGPKNGAKVPAGAELFVLVHVDDNTIAWDVVLIEDATATEVDRIPCPAPADFGATLFDFGAEFPVGTLTAGHCYTIRVEAHDDPGGNNTDEIHVCAVKAFPKTNKEGTVIIRPKG